MAQAKINASEFDDSPEDFVKLWQMELKASDRELEKWHKDGTEVVKRFLDERRGSSQRGVEALETRWNLFSSNIISQQALLYGKTPNVDVVRRFMDTQDEVAGAAGEILQRLLNTEIEDGEDGYCFALEHVLQDRLLPGLGCSKVRYEPKFDQEEVPGEVDEEGQPLTVETKSDECCPIDYVYWGDVRWSPARTWSNVRWIAFRCDMTQEEVEERFGENLARLVPMQTKQERGPSAIEQSIDAKTADPWARAEIWEIWDKERCQVWWVAKGCPFLLDRQDDPYELSGFFPCPRFLLGNLVTTSKLVPRPDFVLAQDLYEEIDFISSRITRLERCLKVVGVYDKTAEGVQRMLQEAFDAQLIPIENWMAMKENGGIAGAISWLPLDAIVSALNALRDYRKELIDALFQITGMSDILRGQSMAGTPATASEQTIKARFGGARVQRTQDEFARYASDLQRLKAELIVKKWDPETILAKSNAMLSYDAPLAMQAIQLLKDRFNHYRIQVKPEAVSMDNFQQMGQERLSLIDGLAKFMTSAMPLAQGMPGSAPFLMELLKWLVASQRGAQSISPVIDAAINAAKQAQAAQVANPPQQQQGPDPKAQAQMMANQQKAQLDQQKLQMETQADLARINAETEANAQRKKDEAVWNLRQEAGRMQMEGKQASTPISEAGMTP